MPDKEKKKSSMRGSQIAAAAVVEPPPMTPEEAASAQAAKEAQDLLDMRALPVRQYLEASVVPLLLHGLQLLAIERYECGHPLSVQQSLVSKASWSSGLFSHSNCSPFLVTLVGFSVIICAGLLRRMRYAG